MPDMANFQGILLDRQGQKRTSWSGVGEFDSLCRVQTHATHADVGFFRHSPGLNWVLFVWKQVQESHLLQYFLSFVVGFMKKL